jgi:hypothetical protein
MKKGFFVPFFVVCIFSNTVINSMTTSKARKPFSYRIPQTKTETVYYTKTSPKKPILFDRLKLYYNQVTQNLSQLWYGQNYQQTILDKTTALLNDIQNKKSRALQSFDTFLETQNQSGIDNFLNTLIFSNQEIDFLNEKTFALLFGISLGNKNNTKIADKIMSWADKNIIRIFSLDLPITDKFFLISLLNINGKLIPAIHDHLSYIQKQPIGQKFLSLLQTEHKEIYDAIMQRKQPIKGILKESMQKSLDELRTKE